MAAARCEITFAGRVQGVGFRATTVSVAHGFDVTGWVRNEADRSVRCVVEGDRAEIERFVEAVKQSMSGYVRDTRMHWSAAREEFNGFHIQR